MSDSSQLQNFLTGRYHIFSDRAPCFSDFPNIAVPRNSSKNVFYLVKQKRLLTVILWHARLMLLTASMGTSSLLYSSDRKMSSLTYKEHFPWEITISFGEHSWKLLILGSAIVLINKQIKINKGRTISVMTIVVGQSEPIENKVSVASIYCLVSVISVVICIWWVSQLKLQKTMTSQQKWQIIYTQKIQRRFLVIPVSKCVTSKGSQYGELTKFIFSVIFRKCIPLRTIKIFTLLSRATPGQNHFELFTTDKKIS